MLAPARAPALCQPASAAEALAMHQHLSADAAYLAGGTALQLNWGVAEEERPTVGTLIDLLGGAVASGICEGTLPDGRPALRIGAATSLEDLRLDASVWLRARRLAEAIGAVGAPGVRHLATIGGNVGWRWGDTLPALLAADAWVELADRGPQPLADVLEGAHRANAALPLIDALLWPHRAAIRPGWSVYEKLGGREAFSPSRLTLGLEARCDEGRVADPRVAVTAAGWPARRLPQVEAWLSGRPAATLASHATALRDACLADVGDAHRARLLARLLVGHFGREAGLHG